MSMSVMLNYAGAMSIDEDKTMELKGKLESRISFRMEESEGYTYPSTQVGNVVQQRNLALIEWNHILMRPVELGPELKYHLVGRFLYEGVYDYGPQGYRDLKDPSMTQYGDGPNIDNFKKDADLWEAYADVTKGKGFLRIGRQNLSWGETDIFQLLDRINPIDNTFGGSFEDLDDRRIPIWMARGTYNLGKIGPVSTVTVEGFFNPGFADQKVAPMAPYGTPYAYPMPLQPPTYVHAPERDFQHSRMGARIQGVVGDNFNFSLAHYQTLVDSPTAVVTFAPSVPGFVTQDLYYQTEQVTGGSLSFFEPHIEAIIRAEVAYFWQEPVFIPEINAPILFGNFQTGTIPTKDVVRYMVGMDKNFWIRFLNSTTMFNAYIQYFAEYYPTYDDRQKVALQRYPTGEMMTQVRYDQKITFILANSWLEGTLKPQIAIAYDPRGAVMTIPSVEYQFDPWRVKVAYYRIDGDNDVSLGILRDRDQLSVSLGLLF
jgi:hypothetical protein